MAKSPKRYLPHIDCLENRVVPAGNVLVAFKGNMLSILGDNQANNISITGNSDGSFTVTSIDVGTINGSTNPFTVTPGDTGKGKGKTPKTPVRLMVNMRGGDDIVDIAGGEATVGKNTSVKLGQGNDVLTVDGLFAGDNARYNGESDDDSITVLNSTFARSALISGGVGTDTINVDSVEFGRAARLDAGNGADFMKVTRSTFETDARITMGAGNDNLELGSNTFSLRDRLDGVSGIDILTHDGANIWASLHTVKGFETVQVGEVRHFGLVTAGNDTASVTPGGSVVISVLANDAATEPNVLDLTSIVIVTQPTSGTVTVNLDGTITYFNTSNLAGTDSFTYTVADNDGHVSAPATVTVTIG